jgi:hypothetical protein
MIKDIEIFPQLPKIKSEDIGKAKTADDAWRNRLWEKIVREYWDLNHELIYEHPAAMQKYNISLYTLLSYWRFLDSMIKLSSYSGFAMIALRRDLAYIFDYPFSEIITSWGAKKTGDIIDKVKIVYEKHKAVFGKENVLIDGMIEYTELYKKKPVSIFERLFKMYFKFIDEEEEIIEKYVQKNVDDFAIII